MPQRLTDRFIAGAKPTTPGLIFDSEVSGLAVKIYASGRKSFVFIWNQHGRQRRTTLGGFPTWTIGKARLHAGKMRLRADTGEEVVAERGEQVAAVIEDWRAVVKLTRRPGTAVGYELAIDNYILPSFGKDTPRDLTRNRIEAWHGTMAQQTPTQANRSLGVLSSFMTWLEHDKRIDGNPCRGVRRCPENQRHVFLDAEEIKAAHAALSGDNNRSAALALRLALLTGCRIGECLHLTAEQIDPSRRLWIKPAATTKQKKVHVVPLQPQALALAQELLSLGLPDYEVCKRCWKRARRIIGRTDVRIHDLRHSRASSLARNGASLMQIGRVLGHTAPATTQRYAHLVDADLVDLIGRTL
jgi:integrase